MDRDTDGVGVSDGEEVLVVWTDASARLDDAGQDLDDDGLSVAQPVAALGHKF